MKKIISFFAEISVFVGQKIKPLIIITRISPRKNYTILWIQGNHENYDMIEEFPTEEWHGGKVRQILRDKVILLERGQVFEIDGKTFFTFGGASSHDIQGGVLDRDDIDYEDDRRKAIKSGLQYRIKHESWWEQELPNEEEMEEGRRNLEADNCLYKHICESDIIKKEVIG